MTLFKLLLLLLLFCSLRLRAQVALEQAFPNLTFANPVDFQSPRDGSPRVFVVEQAGIIRVFTNLPSASSSSVFLDIRDRVTSGGELGLLGLAFHPRYASNGYFYLNYTASHPLRTVIARYTVSPINPSSADKNSEVVLLTYNQPYSNHNGGQISFGPDGYLYIASGDGGSAGDPQNNAQNLTNLLGKILRINVNNSSGGRAYGIPPDNPFAGNTTGAREEIYAYGLRNPWRFSFDASTGRLWTGDVGQNRLEEINIVEKGKNYGWRIMEGTLCYNPSSGCNTTGLELPVWQYGRSEGYSVTGGFVYRGTRNPELTGLYVYGDYGTGRIWSLRYDGMNPPVNVQIAQLGTNRLSSFGVDQNNELYLCSFDGKIYRFQPSTATSIQAQPDVSTDVTLFPNYPQPFNPHTTIRLKIAHPMNVRLSVHSVLGEELRLLFNDVLSAGIHSFLFDASRFASGVYFCRLQAGEKQLTQRLLLLR
jgi:glucose/arabinose dehydrogenase